YLNGGETLDEFLHQLPSVEREQALAQKGELLALAAPEFTAFLTMDRKLPQQQNTAMRFACRLNPSWLSRSIRLVLVPLLFVTPSYAARVRLSLLILVDLASQSGAHLLPGSPAPPAWSPPWRARSCVSLQQLPSVSPP